MRIYATKQDLVDEVGLELSDQEAKDILRKASLVVENATINSEYEVDEDGYPTDPRVVRVFTLATCVQAKSLDESSGSLSLGSEGPSQLGSLKFGSSGDSSGAGSDAVQADPEVALLLSTEGLLSAQVRVLR